MPVYLTMIGETGLARRPVIEAQAAEMLGIKKAGGSIQALIVAPDGSSIDRDLPSLGGGWSWHRRQVSGPGAAGRTRPNGILAAHWGTTRSVNEYDLLLERHVSPEHTLLNLQAADVLREAGYQVNLTPPDVNLPDGGLFKPDLVLDR